MNVLPKPLPLDPSGLRGLSEKLIRSHHENNYVGAVRRLSAIRSRLASSDFQAQPNFELNGLKREELIAANSMLLHELYFANLGNSPDGIPAPMAVALQASFGSVERWEAEFTAMARALSGGSGWVLLTYSPREAVLTNQWASDHTQVLAGATPILALDMYEHAYHLDFGAGAAAYIEAFMGNIEWRVVHERYQQAIHATSEPHSTAPDDLRDALLLDVRRAGAFEHAQELIPGASWRDPALIGLWSRELPADQTIVVYCVAGHEISRAVATRLRASGIDARFMAGGIEAWKASGRPLATKTTLSHGSLGSLQKAIAACEATAPADGLQEKQSFKL